MSSYQQDDVIVVGCSVRGPKHEVDGSPCQDAWAGAALPGNRIVIAVGDGLGSAEQSQIGSEVAVNEAVDTLEVKLADVDAIEEESAKTHIKEAVTAAREAVFEEADQRDLNVEELGTTLLTLIAGPSGTAGAIVGDGGLVVEHLDGYEKLVPREMKILDYDRPNITTPLPSASWEDSYRFGYCEGVEAAAVFTDGVDPWAWKDLKTIEPDFFEEVIPFVRGNSNPEEAAQSLADYLDNEHHREIKGDDKTLAIGLLPETTTEPEGVTEVKSEDEADDEQTESSLSEESITDPENKSEEDTAKEPANGESVPEKSSSNNIETEPTDDETDEEQTVVESPTSEEGVLETPEREGVEKPEKESKQGKTGPPQESSDNKSQSQTQKGVGEEKDDDERAEKHEEEQVDGQSEPKSTEETEGETSRDQIDEDKKEGEESGRLSNIKDKFL